MNKILFYNEDEIYGYKDYEEAVTADLIFKKNIFPLNSFIVMKSRFYKQDDVVDLTTVIDIILGTMNKKEAFS